MARVCTLQTVYMLQEMSLVHLDLFDMLIRLVVVVHGAAGNLETRNHCRVKMYFYERAKVAN